ncbi:MAG: hypothetical protein KAJ93_08750 [Methanosarcinales archaeon]|nr:hypothetical protein [Methanosarcinales archaeon]
MKLFGYEPKEFRSLLANFHDFKNTDYQEWITETKQPPGMMEIYAQYFFGAVMGQTFPALFILEWLLNLYPVKQIVEIGTGTGGLSAFLQLQANIRGLGFVTYDAQERFGDKRHLMVANPPLHLKRYINFRQGNVFDADVTKEIQDLLKQKVSLLYVDNGNKPKELKTFAPHCLPGSIVGTHDWNGQFGIEDMLEKYEMEIILQDVCEEGKTKMRFWTKGA